MTATRSPTMVEVLSQALDESSQRINVAIPGKVEAWSRTTQTARIRPCVLKPDGTERAVTIYVPVIFPGVYWDLQVDDYGLLLIADEDFHAWWRTDEISLPESTASHQIQNAFFLPGVKSKDNPYPIPANVAVLEKPVAGGYVYLGDDGADKFAVHEDLLSALNSFMADLATWVTAVDGAAGPFASTALLQAEITAIIAGIAANSYQSPSVKVES